MIELLIELLAGGLFELFAELIGYVGRTHAKDDDELNVATPEPTPWSPVVQQSRSVLTLKLMLGAIAGTAWGLYVGSSTDVEWPLTFWSFSAIGVVAYALRLAGVTNEGSTVNITNRILRGMVTFTPQRFANWAALSLVTAICVALGFVIAS